MEKQTKKLYKALESLKEKMKEKDYNYHEKTDLIKAIKQKERMIGSPWHDNCKKQANSNMVNRKRT